VNSGIHFIVQATWGCFIPRFPPELWGKFCGIRSGTAKRDTDHAVSLPSEMTFGPLEAISRTFR
jgi:hypothetical protein